jgi:hypothetical protein
MRRAPRLLAQTLAASLVLGAACQRRAPPPPGAAPERGAPVVPAPGAAAPPPPLPDDLEPAPVAPAATDTVKIKLVADPRRQARVYWGRKDLGLAPVEIERPRGSGPLDLLVLAPGFLPLHTRAFTDRDETLTLRLYSEGDASSLPGYRRP